MNPDLFITIAFTGIAVLVAVLFVALVVPRARREARVQERESMERRSRLDAAQSD